MLGVWGVLSCLILLVRGARDCRIQDKIGTMYIVDLLHIYGEHL